MHTCTDVFSGCCDIAVNIIIIITRLRDACAHQTPAAVEAVSCVHDIKPSRLAVYRSPAQRNAESAPRAHALRGRRLLPIKNAPVLRTLLSTFNGRDAALPYAQPFPSLPIKYRRRHLFRVLFSLSFFVRTRAMYRTCVYNNANALHRYVVLHRVRHGFFLFF